MCKIKIRIILKGPKNKEGNVKTPLLSNINKAKKFQTFFYQLNRHDHFLFNVSFLLLVFVVFFFFLFGVSGLTLIS